MDPRQANLLPYFLLLNSPLHFSSTPACLGVIFDHTLCFSKHVSSLKAKFFRRLKRLRYISASSWGPSKESLSFFCLKLFFGPFSLMPHPDGFLPLVLPTLSRCNAFTKWLVAPLPLPLVLPICGVSISHTSHPDSFCYFIV